MPAQFHIKNNDTVITAWQVLEPEEDLINQVVLHEYELQKFNLIKNSQARLSFLAIRIMHGKTVLSPIQYNENGKPFVEGSYVSISHSGIWNVILHSKKEDQGIDIEKVQPRILKIRSRFLDEEEEAICAGSLEKYTLCWSAKEAIFKKYGNETVFFRANQKIIEIDEKNKLLTMKIFSGQKEVLVKLAYLFPDKDYVLVYTL